MIKKFIQIVALITALLSFLLFGFISYYKHILPNNFYLIEDKEFSINSLFKIKADYSSGENVTSASSSNSNSTKVNLKLFGLIPIKDVQINEVKEINLFPGGIPFGIKMFTEGVMVVGINGIETQSGTQNPAKIAGLKIGDVLLEIGGRKIANNDDLSNVVSNSRGNSIKILYRRNESVFETYIKPAISREDKDYKIGVWVRDSSAGIGTVTFYNPENNIFGGLGHPISDVDTGKILPLMSGDVVDVNINGIIKGSAGIPGELKGNFVSSIPIGSILSNDETGVYGILYDNLFSGSFMPIALKQEIKPGKAKILTTIEGNTPKEYEIKIEKVNLNDNNDLKNMVIKIVDQELLEKTGGIVQGMSGSPIIQEGKLVGAVTHVFVNDPNRGYGIFLENMYDQSNLIDVVKFKNAS